MPSSTTIDHRLDRSPRPRPARSSDRPRALGERRLRVAQHHDLVADPMLLAPGGHHERVVRRDTGDRRHPASLQPVRILHEARQMLRRAHRRVGARQAEQDDLLALQQRQIGPNPRCRPGPFASAWRAAPRRQLRWSFSRSCDGVGAYRNTQLARPAANSSRSKFFPMTTNCVIFSSPGSHGRSRRRVVSIRTLWNTRRS